MTGKSVILALASALFFCGCITYSAGIASNQLSIQYHGFEVLYDTECKIPIWVRYELTADETDGPYSRKGKNYRRDDSIGVDQADSEDYRNSGWSRGHMAPAADFKWDDKAIWDTFYYTNCCPQNTRLNNGQWSTLEKKVRQWANKYGKVYVYTGSIVGENVYGTIGQGNVTVPDAFFKCVLADTQDGLQAIAFVMLNQEHNENLQKCAMSVDSLEEITGTDFFPELQRSVADIVESTYSLRYWN